MAITIPGSDTELTNLGKANLTALVAAANRASEKNPAATSMYQDFINGQYGALKKAQENLRVNEGRPVALSQMRAEEAIQLQKANNEFGQKYFSSHSAGNVAEQNRLEDNGKAMKLLDKELNGDPLGVRFVKRFYDEEKNGTQWGSIIGGGLGILGGLYMGMTIAGPTGGGLLGFAAIATTTLGLMALGSTYGEKLMPPASTPNAPVTTPAAGPEQSPSQSQTLQPILSDEVKQQVDESKKSAPKPEEQNKHFSPGDTGNLTPLATHTKQPKQQPAHLAGKH